MDIAIPETIGFLNGLSPELKIALYAKMNREEHIRAFLPPTSLRGITYEDLRKLDNPAAPNFDGKFWEQFLTCQTPRGIRHSEHHRFQFRFPQASGGHLQRKIFTHVIAYASVHNSAPLPATLGRGTSVDHLCGQKACSRPEHITFANRHRDNVARIGCSGVTLVVMNNTILRMVPCPHANEGEGVEPLTSGCAKIHVIVLHIDDL